MAVRFSSSTQNYSYTLSLSSLAQFSVTCWGKISVDRAAASTFWSIYTGNTSFIWCQTKPDGISLIAIDDLGKTTAGVILTTGKWYFIGFSVNAGAGTLVVRAIDDSAFTSQTYTGGSTTNATTLSLGTNNLGQFLNGCLAAFKFWNGVTLTSAELQSEALTFLPHRVANLGAWYPFTTADTVDYSGNGRALSGGSGATTEVGPPISWGSRRLGLRIPTTQSYNLTASDTLVDTDALAGSSSLHQVPADSLVAAEALIERVSLFRTLPDSVIVADTGGRVGTVNRLSTDAFVDVDVLAGTRGDSRSLSDVLTDADTPAWIRSNSRNLQDALAGIEILAERRGISRALPDATIVLDALTGSLGSFRLLVDTLVDIEIASISQIQARSLGDYVIGSDVLAIVQIVYRSGLELNNLAETEVHSVSAPRGTVDGLISSDSSLLSTELTRVLVDIDGFADIPILRQGLARSLSDLSDEAEMISTTTVVMRGLVDTVTDFDLLALSQGSSRLSVNSLAMIDLDALGYMGYHRDPVDAINLVEILTYIFSPGRVIADLLQIVETLTDTRILLHATSDITITSETFSRQISISRGIDDISSISDNCVPASTVARLINDMALVVETFTAAVTLDRNPLDIFDLAEVSASQAAHVGVRDIADVVSLAEIPTRSIQIFVDVPDILDLAEVMDVVIGLERDQADGEDIGDSLDQIIFTWRDLAESLDLAEIISTLTILARDQIDNLDLAELIGIGRAVTSEDILTADDSGIGAAAVQRAFSEDFSFAEFFTSTAAQFWGGEEEFSLRDKEVDSRNLIRGPEDLLDSAENILALAWYYQDADDLLSTIDAASRAKVSARPSADLSIVDEIAEGTQSIFQVIAEYLARDERAASIRAVAKDSSDSLITVDMLLTALSLAVVAPDTAGIIDSPVQFLVAVRASADNLRVWAWYGEGIKTLHRFLNETVHAWAWYEEGTKSLTRFLDESIDSDEYYEEGVRYLFRDVSESVDAVDLLSGFVGIVKNLRDLLHVWAWYEEGVRYLTRNLSEELLIGETTTSGWPRITFDILDLDEYYEEGVNHLTRATPDTLTLTPLLFIGPINIPSTYLYSSTMIADHGERATSVFRNVGGKTHLDQGS